MAISTVTEKIIFDDSGSEPRALAVEVSQSAKSPKYRVGARKEIIVSCGVVATPQLLLLSGLGPKEDLAPLDIKVVKDLPQVGRNYRDVR